MAPCLSLALLEPLWANKAPTSQLAPAPRCGFFCITLLDVSEVTDTTTTDLFTISLPTNGHDPQRIIVILMIQGETLQIVSNRVGTWVLVQLGVCGAGPLKNQSRNLTPKVFCFHQNDRQYFLWGAMMMMTVVSFSTRWHHLKTNMWMIVYIFRGHLKNECVLRGSL